LRMKSWGRERIRTRRKTMRSETGSRGWRCTG
jgi:hypothetical protein